MPAKFTFVLKGLNRDLVHISNVKGRDEDALQNMPNIGTIANTISYPSLSRMYGIALNNP